MPAWLIPVLATFLLAAAACANEPAATPPAPPEPAASAAPDPAPQPPPPAAEAQDRVAASHILVAYEAAQGRPMNVRRTADEARRQAEALRARALAGEDFAALAREASDDASAPRGGFLGGIGRGTMVAPFEEAAFALPIGGISEVVETPFGFHVIRREVLAEAHVAQVLVQWTGAEGAHSGRSEDEARARAERAWERLQQGEPFEVVARDLSDGAAGLRGGDLGWFTRGQFLPAWEEVAFALAPGETSLPFRTQVGFHVIKRLE